MWRFKKKFKNQKEFEVSVIITKDEKSAKNALKALGAGKDFAAVAAEYSIEPNTKKQGGRLGYLVEGAVGEVLGPDVGKALKILKDNVYSKKPIKLKDGKYIIVRRGNSRAAVAPTFEEIKPQLKSMYSQKALGEYIDSLRKTAKVEVFTMDGKPDTFQSPSKTPLKK